MSCSVSIYKHKNYGGSASTVTGTWNDLNHPHKDPGRNDITSLIVHGDGCNNGVYTGCRHPLNDQRGKQCRYFKGHEPNLNHRRKYNDNNWNDDIDSFRWTPIPGADANNMAYDLRSDHYTPASPGDGYCGGCRLWPEVKDLNNHANANRDDVWLRDSNVGYSGVRPCPGGNGYFNSGSGVRCIYSKVDDGGQLRGLYSAVKDVSDDRRAMYDVLKMQFCSIGENRNKNVGEGKCTQIGDAAALARAYCAVGDRIKTDDTCTEEDMGTRPFHDLAKAYCDAHPGDEWCACYNVHTKKCDADESLAGCAKVREEHDAIVESLPSDELGEQARRELNNRKTCRAMVCTDANETYKPENLPGCELNIDMCINEVNVGGHVVDTGIVQNCDKGEKGGKGGKGNDEELKGIRKALTIGGGVTGAISSSMCLLIIIVLVFVVL